LFEVLGEQAWRESRLGTPADALSQKALTWNSKLLTCGSRWKMACPAQA
jgi:hypothetical protein